MTNRRKFTSEFKKKVVLEALKERETLSERIRPAKYILPLVKKLLADGFCLHHLRGWGPPISGQELRYGFLRMVFQPLQHVLHPFPGVDPGGLARRKKGVHHRRPFGCVVGAAEQVVLTPDGHRADRVFYQVVVNFDAPVVQVNL